jgi:hypothetical protein
MTNTKKILSILSLEVMMENSYFQGFIKSNLKMPKKGK